MTDPRTVTLADRYVQAVVRRLPERSRSDVARELRALLDDEVDARTASGVTAKQAERDAVESLGDPARLAASYANRPLHLIGPEHFLEWARLLRLLLAIVLPCLAGALILAGLLENAAAGEIAIETFATLLAVAVHLCFWVTVVFAMIERFAPNTRTGEAWNADHLDAVEPDRVTQRSSLVSAAVWFVIVTTALVVQQFAEPVIAADGTRAPVLDPALWTWWLPYFIAVSFAELVLVFVAYRRGTWNLTDAVLNIVTAGAFAVPFVVLAARQQLASPELMRLIVEATDAEVLGILTSLVIAVAIVAALWDSVDGVLRAARAYRSRVSN